MDDAFLELAESLLVIAGSDDHIQAAGSAWQAVLGHVPSALVGRSWQELVHPEDAALATVAEDAVQVRVCHARGGHRTFRLRKQRRDGHVYLAFLPLMAEPVGEARKPEFLQHVLEQVPAVLWTTDTELRFTSSAGAGMNLIGLTAKQVVGLSLYDYFYTQDPEFRPIAAHRAALAGAASDYDIHWKGVTWAAHVEPLTDDAGHIVGTLGLSLDVTAERRSARELRSERERLAVTLRSIGDGVVATDREGRVVLLNRVAEELTGWSEAEALGRQVAEVVQLVDETTRAPCQDPVAQVFAAGRVVGTTTRSLLLARDGSERAIADSGAPMLGSDGELQGAVLVLRDVTLERRVDRELRTTQRLQSLGVLAGGIAHDFNNMLTMILANVSVVHRRVKSDPMLSSILADVEQASERATGLTRQLLAFSRGGAPVRRPAVLGELIRSTAEFALRGARSRCHVEIDPQLACADVDEGQITQVLSNLVINADEAMPDGGTVRVSARNLTLVPPHPSRLPPGEYVEIEVRDHGVGIAAEILERVFDPFFSTKERGSGLGLASAHGIVESHEGRVSLVSREGAGTIVTVLLPASATRPEELEASAPRPAPSGRGRVLVMDDEPHIRRAASRLLEELGYQAVVAADGDAAVEAYRLAAEAGTPFDVVILDLTVPGGMGGVEALRQLRALDPRVRAVVSSGYAADRVLAEYRERGFVGVLPKPYRIERLAELLAEVLADDGAPAHD